MKIESETRAQGTLSISDLRDSIDGEHGIGVSL